MNPLGTADYLVIGFYLAFMVAMGPAFKSFSRTASDFFRGGGNMTWWIAAASMFMTGFSAWTYMGMAGRIHESGLFFLTLMAANFLAMLFTVFFTAHRFRQMRVVTGNEAVRKRFGLANEQIMTWLPFPTGLLNGGVSLYIISLFMSCVFGLDMMTLILILAGVVVVMTVVGGSWAATAGDFVQMIMLVSITVVMALLVLGRADVGGVSGLVEKVAARPELYDLTLSERPWILVVYFLTLIVNQTVLQNNLAAGAGKFIFVKTGRDARLIAGISGVAGVVNTIIFMVPPLACAVLFPTLADCFPGLKTPSEGAYVHMAVQVLPTGLLGLLVCGIFAATLTSMNSGLSATSAMIIRNGYLPLVAPKASERRQIWLGRLATVVLGGCYVLVAVYLDSLKELNLYNLVLQIAPTIGLPSAVPLLLGMFMRRSPGWACWSTLLVGFAAGLGIHAFLTEANLKAWFELHGTPLTGLEAGDLKTALVTGILLVVCVGWFLLATAIGVRRERRAAELARADAFIGEMNTPIDPAAESPDVGAHNDDARQCQVIGLLCLIYGFFILCLLVFDHTATGRLCVIGIGGLMAGIGAFLRHRGRALAARRPLAQEPSHALHD